MHDFIDSLLTFLIGVCIGMLIGFIILAMTLDKKFTKFCPQCGNRFENGEVYCPNDGTELLTMGG